MVVIKDKNRKVIGTSQTLRGVLDRARRVGIVAVDIERLDDGRGWVMFTFRDGSFCETEFASYNVLVRWLKARRAWRGTPVFVFGATSGFDI